MRNLDFKDEQRDGDGEDTVADAERLDPLDSSLCFLGLRAAHAIAITDFGRLMYWRTDTTAALWLLQNARGLAHFYEVAVRDQWGYGGRRDLTYALAEARVSVHVASEGSRAFVSKRPNRRALTVEKAADRAGEG